MKYPAVSSPAPNDGSRPILDWGKSDIENRCGFRPGRFTNVNVVFAGIVAILLSIGFYAAISPFDGTWFADMFTKRGPTQYATVLLSWWAVVILIVKSGKLRFQKKALDIHIMPEDPGFILSAATVDPVLTRIYQTADNPRAILLYNRIINALSNLRNLGQVTEVDSLIRSHADQDEAALNTSYSLVQGFVWAIPVLGFIGTVLGLSEAIGQFSGVLDAASDVERITQALKGVTAGLATAFETTLVALVAALFIQLAVVFLRKQEDEFLDEAMDYCHRFVVGRLRILP